MDKEMIFLANSAKLNGFEPENLDKVMQCQNLIAKSEKYLHKLEPTDDAQVTRAYLICAKIKDKLDDIEELKMALEQVVGDSHPRFLKRVIQMESEIALLRKELDTQRAEYLEHFPVFRRFYEEC